MMHDPYLPRVRAIIETLRRHARCAGASSPPPRREEVERLPLAAMRGRIIVGQRRQA